jgi:hypothetical protein
MLGLEETAFGRRRLALPGRRRQNVGGLVAGRFNMLLGLWV